jgi:membrane-associated phospholipid phosphatase
MLEHLNASMTGWQTGAVIYFAYAAALGDLLPGLALRARVWAVVSSALGAAVTIAASRLPSSHPLNVWVIPPVVLYLSYRATGVLFASPMPRMERAFVAFDEALGIDRIAPRIPRWLAELLEFAYASIYTLAVLALVLALWIGVTAARFWTVVLVTDYVCFGMLPWIRTRTPRETIVPEPWRSSLRAINLRLVEAAGIGVNTFPSGHAAEALVAALLAAGTPWPISAGMFLAAAAVSAGAVFGRYHYAADVLAGWCVALAVYLLIT